MQLFSQTFGTGAHQLLGLHCTLGHGAAFAPLARALGDDFRLHTFDLPGHGRSDDWDGKTDLHALSTQMGKSMLSRPMDVIGHSYGAVIALRIAIENPQLVRNLILIEPVFFAPALQDDPTSLDMLRESNNAFESAMKNQNKESATIAFYQKWGDGPDWKDLPDHTKKYMLERIDFVSHSKDFVHFDSAGLLKKNRFSRAEMPILLLHGARSIAAPIVNTAIARRLPNAICKSIPKAGHMAPLTHPKEVAELILTHLNKCKVGVSPTGNDC